MIGYQVVVDWLQDAKQDWRVVIDGSCARAHTAHSLDNNVAITLKARYLQTLTQQFHCVIILLSYRRNQ